MPRRPSFRVFAAVRRAAAVFLFAGISGLAAQGSLGGLSSVTGNPWIKPLVPILVDRLLRVSSDPGEVVSFLQANADDFSPGLFKTGLGPEWRAVAGSKLDDSFRAPLADRVEFSFNIFSLAPSASLKVHLLPENAWFPQVSVAGAGFFVPANFALPGFALWSVAPSITVAKSINPDAKVFGGWQMAFQTLTIPATLLGALGVTNDLVTVTNAHTVFAGAVIVDKVNAEWSAWAEVDLTKQAFTVKAERTWNGWTWGLSYYPNYALALFPLNPYLRFRMRF